jgi:thymidylate kinase
MPLITVSGTQGVGKTTFINDFIAQWPTYQTPDRTYRDIIKEKGLEINKQTSQRSQSIILDAIIESMEQYSKTDNIIFDRCPLDNLVYSIWAYDKGVSDIDEGFVAECITRCKNATQKIDLMLMIPLSKHNLVENIDEDKDTREKDPTYQLEINELFLGLKKHRDEGDDTYFVKDNCSPIIEIFGNRQERIAMAQLYLNEAGNFFGEEDNLLFDARGDAINSNPEDLIDTGERDQLRQQLGLSDEMPESLGTFKF